MTDQDEPAVVLTGPIARVCPACQAQPGKPCTQPTENSRRPVTWFHLMRENPDG
jgi:hypothetical protein